MKKVAMLLIAMSVLLSGCVVYDPNRDAGMHRGDRDRSHERDRDRDRDGVPNRVDRDRDGDGVPNNHDNRPNDPRRY